MIVNHRNQSVGVHISTKKNVMGIHYTRSPWPPLMSPHVFLSNIHMKIVRHCSCMCLLIRKRYLLSMIYGILTITLMYIFVVVTQCNQKAVLAECSLFSVIKITLIIIDSHLITSGTLSPSLRITMIMLLLSVLAW